MSQRILLQSGIDMIITIVSWMHMMCQDTPTLLIWFQCDCDRIFSLLPVLPTQNVSQRLPAGLFWKLLCLVQTRSLSLGELIPLKETPTNRNGWINPPGLSSTLRAILRYIQHSFLFEPRRIKPWFPTMVTGFSSFFVSLFPLLHLWFLGLQMLALRFAWRLDDLI